MARTVFPLFRSLTQLKLQRAPADRLSKGRESTHTRKDITSMAAKQFAHTMSELIARHPYWSATTIQLAKLMREHDDQDTVEVSLSLFDSQSFV